MTTAEGHLRLPRSGPTTFLRREDDAGVRYELSGPRVTVGRDQSNDIALRTDMRVSRHHAALERKEDGWVVVDLGSANGTFLNGRRIESGSVGAGDRIRVGSTTLVLVPSGDVDMTVTGEESRVPARDLATVVFTDICGSTERAAQLGDRAWHALLQRHHSAVRQQLRLFGGSEVDTAGDGFLALFPSPGRAIECAAAIHEAVRALGLEVRVGIHTGECEVVDDDVAGIAVHIGARVASRARAAETLVSSTVRDLVAGSAFLFSDRGLHQLKGVPGEWRLFEVRHRPS